MSTQPKTPGQGITGSSVRHVERSVPTRDVRRGAAAGLALLTLGIAPATAAAVPSISVDRGCYTEGMPINVSGAGFTAGGPVNLLFAFGGGLGSVELQADSAGTIAAGVETPEVGQRREDVSLTANDVTRMEDPSSPPEEQFALTEFLFSQWDVDTAWSKNRIARGKPKRSMTVDAYGWVGSATSTLYAHYTRRGRLVKTVKVGRLTGPCGDVRKTMRQFPFRPVPAGTYGVHFDTTKTWPNRDDRLTYKRVTIARSDALR